MLRTAGQWATTEPYLAPPTAALPGMCRAQVRLPSFTVSLSPIARMDGPWALTTPPAASSFQVATVAPIGPCKVQAQTNPRQWPSRMSTTGGRWEIAASPFPPLNPRKERADPTLLSQRDNHQGNSYQRMGLFAVGVETRQIRPTARTIMALCPQCSSPPITGDLFCRKCGTALVPSAPVVRPPSLQTSRAK